MGKSTPPGEDRAAELIDEIGAANRVLWRSQARQAALMVEFCDARKAADKRIITDHRTTGADPMFKAGEFAACEVSLAVKTSKFITQRTIAMTRRVQSEAPDVWDAWEHGDIDNDKVVRVNRALRRLVHQESKELLNTLVVPVAIEKTPEILGRWLNQFIAEVEPDETDERLRRSFDDRYVSVRPDIDGISVLHAALSSVDAAAVDQILNALASIAEPGDERTKQQRRADALVDLLCGRISNGCHTDFDTNTDTDDHLDDNPPEGARARESDKAGGNKSAAAGGHRSGQSGAGLDLANGESDPAHGVVGPPDGEFSPAEAGPAHVIADQPDNATAHRAVADYINRAKYLNRQLD